MKVSENKYSIHQVEVLSDIKAHTLRIWEKRYGIIEPKRTESNFRYFDEDDLKKILNISYLNKNGIKISKISKLTDQEIANQVLDTYNHSKGDPEIMQLLAAALMTYDLRSFEQIFDDYLNVKSFEECINEVIYPFFEKIGILWQTDKICPAQEHLFSHFIKLKITSEIELIKAKPTKDKILLFLRENEYHELGLLVYHYALKKKGYEVFNLGQSVPFENLERVLENIQPTHVLTAFVAYLEKDSFNDYLKDLKGIFPGELLFVFGNLDFLEEHNVGDSYTIIKNLKHLNQTF